MVADAAEYVPGAHNVVLVDVQDEPATQATHALMPEVSATCPAPHAVHAVAAATAAVPAKHKVIGPTPLTAQA